MATQVSSNALEIRAREKLTEIPLPKGVRLSKIYFDSDWSGDPATRVVFGVSTKVPLTKTRVRDLNQLTVKTETALAPIREGGLVYVSFKDVK